eukprot:7376642-Prymnesium_polylepis.2
MSFLEQAEFAFASAAPGGPFISPTVETILASAALGGPFISPTVETIPLETSSASEAMTRPLDADA